MMRLIEKLDYAVHIVAWAALAVAAALNAGSYTLASCWPVPFGLFPPLGIALLAIPFFSVCGLSYRRVADTTPEMKARVHRISLHGSILSLGVFCCWVAAMLSVENPSCL